MLEIALGFKGILDEGHEPEPTPTDALLDIHPKDPLEQLGPQQPSGPRRGGRRRFRLGVTVVLLSGGDGGFGTVASAADLKLERAPRTPWYLTELKPLGGTETA